VDAFPEVTHGTSKPSRQCKPNQPAAHTDGDERQNPHEEAVSFERRLVLREGELDLDDTEYVGDSTRLVAHTLEAPRLSE
jgi:hypothetical protein